MFSFCFSSTKRPPSHINLMLNWWIKLYQAQNQFCTYSLERTKSLSKDKAQKMHLETLISPGPLYVILNKEQKKAPLETLYQLLNRDIACTGRLMISISILRTALPGLMITSKCLFMSLSQFTEKQMPRLSFSPLSFLLCNQLTSAKAQQYLLFAGILWSLVGSGGNFTYISFSYWPLLLQKPPDCKLITLLTSVGGFSFDNMGQTIFHMAAVQESPSGLPYQNPNSRLSSAFDIPTLSFEPESRSHRYPVSKKEQSKSKFSKTENFRNFCLSTSVPKVCYPLLL